LLCPPEASCPKLAFPSLFVNTLPPTHFLQAGLLVYSYNHIEDDSWKFLPEGIRGEYAPGTHWSVTLDVAVRLMFDGRLQVLEQFGGPSFAPGNVTGVNLALPVNYRFSATLSAGLHL
jgi:hypothetical protein